jgi:hypothetical protein
MLNSNITNLPTELVVEQRILVSRQQVVNSSKEMGFNVKELEIKSEDDYTDDD